MMGNKMFWGLCIGFFYSIVFSETDILWDFGVVINSPKLKKSYKHSPQQSSKEQTGHQKKINWLTIRMLKF